MVIQKEINMDQSYLEMIETLKAKYGPVPGDYFLTPTCKSKNNKITRGSEGLYVHHVREDTFIDLCQTAQALTHPWEYQQAANLVYCNIWEHFQLHCKIMLENATFDRPEMVGFGGVFIFLSAQIIDLFCVKNPKRVDVKKSREIMLLHRQDFVELYSKMIHWICNSDEIQAKKFQSFIAQNFGIQNFRDWAIHRSAIKEMFEKKGLKFFPKWFATSFQQITSEIADEVKKNDK